MSIPPQAFHDTMLRIDADLRQRGIDIPFRPLAAIGAWAKDLHADIPMSFLPAAPDEITPRTIAYHVDRWYTVLYGDRLKLKSFSPGRLALLINGDLWTIELPAILGTVSFAACQYCTHDHTLENGQYNVFDLFRGMTQTYRSSLTEASLRSVLDVFMLGMRSLSALSRDAENTDLTKAARADHDAAVRHLAPEATHPGLSRWASLQAVEKLIKAVLIRQSLGAPRTHNLHALAASLPPIVSGKISPKDLQNVFCLPGVRYGEFPTTIPEAVEAHHAALRITEALVPFLLKARS